MKDLHRKSAELARLRQRRIASLERKAALEKKIGELNERLAAIVEHSNDAIIGKDLDGVITSWNKGAERIYGYAAGEMIGRSISMLSPSGQPDEVPQILERIRRGEIIEHYETVRTGKDGKRVWISLTVSPIKGYDSRIMGASSIARDITRRRKAEETVQRQAQTLNQILGSVITTNLDGYITSWNKGSERMFSYTADEAIGEHVSFIYPEDERDFLAKEIIGPLKEKGDHEREVRLRRRSGETFHALLLLTLLRDENGSVTGMIGSSVDISERKKAEGKIILAKEEWEQTFDAMPDIVAVIDTRHIIRRANKTLASRLGIDRQELAGKFCHKAICGSEKPISNCPGDMAVGTGKAQVEERFLENLNGHYLISCNPISSSDGSITGFVEVCRDISERRNIEERLREAAIRDALTGLFNRRGFLTLAVQQLNIAGRNKRNMALLFMDLNNMKEINDKFGHKQGDQALVDTANLLRKTFRESDIIARMGGDEFAVLLAEPSERDIEHIILEHLQNNLKVYNEQNIQRGCPYQLSLSTGISYYDPERPCSVDELLTSADRRMYKEKEAYRWRLDHG
jgi:diguanylate cyclase (GGDEF)-like protein/PAS domain S-box-containing protein